MSIKLPSGRLLAAGIVAVVADILQYVLIPLGTPLGIFDPDGVDQILDITVAGIMVWLLGFHWVFVPSAMGKLIPAVDMMPFWTGAVFFVGLGQDAQQTVPGTVPVQTLPDSGAHSQPTLPAVASPASPYSVDAQTAKALHPFFRDIDSK
jgi:hypothetical protein